MSNRDTGDRLLFLGASDRWGPKQYVHLVRQFVGRGWAFARVVSWFQDGRSPLLLITGPPGSGKTTLTIRLHQLSRGEAAAANISRSNCHIDAVIICDDRVFESIQASSVLQNLGQQLAENVPGYAKHLLSTSARDRGGISTGSINQRVGRVSPGAKVSMYGVVVNIEEKDPRLLYDYFIRRPLTALYQESGRCVVIMIDALNEAEQVAKLLQDEAGNPVPGLRMIITTSRGASEQEFYPCDRFDIVGDEPTVGADVRAYCRSRLTGQVPAPDRLAARIASVDGGNFLYGHYLVEDVLEGRITPVEALNNPLPQGLAGIYEMFMRRLVGTDRDYWRTLVRPVLASVVLGHGEGITARQIEAMTGFRESEVDDALRACMRYLRGRAPSGSFRPYHSSFASFLLSPGDFYIYPREASYDIVDRLISPYRNKWKECEPAILRYAVEYVADALSFQDEPSRRVELGGLLAEMIGDPEFLVQMATRDGIDHLLVMIDRAVAADVGPSAALEPIQSIISRQARNLIRVDPGEFRQAFFLQCQFEAVSQRRNCVR